VRAGFRLTPASGTAACDAEGVVQLDSCCMHGPTRRARGVAGIEGVRTPSLVAKAVLESTDHHLLVGRGAPGSSRATWASGSRTISTPRPPAGLWLEWKRRIDPEHYLDPKKRGDAALMAGLSMVRDGLIDPNHFWGTINCDGINSRGELCGVTTTSGLAWKIPGRVGDSPSWAPGSTWTTRWAPPGPRVAARQPLQPLLVP